MTPAGTSRRPRSRKPAEQQTRVIAKKLAGKTYRQIAAEEGIAKGTVGSILRASQYDAVMKQHRTEVLGLVPKSIAHYNKVLDQSVGTEEPVAPFGASQYVTPAMANRFAEIMYQRGYRAGLDATKVSSDVLHGTQVFVTKSEQITHDEPEELSDDELDHRILSSLARITTASGAARA